MSQELSELLNNFNFLRNNFTAHNPQAMLNASEEVTKNEIPDDLKDSVKIEVLLNPVIIEMVEYYETLEVVSFLIYTENRLDDFNKILKQMKNDYSYLWNSLESKSIVIGSNNPFEVQYIERNVIKRFDGMQNKTVEIAARIKKRNYDGSKESYKKATEGLSLENK